MSHETMRLHWLAATACMPSWTAAARYLVARTKAEHPDLELNLTYDGSLRDVSSFYLQRVAEMIREPELSTAWRLLALTPKDAPGLVKSTAETAKTLLGKLNGATATEARARLDAWATAPVVDGGSKAFFPMAEDASLTHSPLGHDQIPTCVKLLEQDQWDAAFAWLASQAALSENDPNIGAPASHSDRKQQLDLINTHAELLWAQGRANCGALALAWQMMTCDPERPESFNAVLPQLTWILENCSVNINPDRRRRLKDRLRIWWQAGRGAWSGAVRPVSIFRIAQRETGEVLHGNNEDFILPEIAKAPLPPVKTVVVMKKDGTEEKGLPQVWRDLRDQPLPLVLCHDATAVRDQLQEEYPHAFREISLLTQDLRSGEPVRIKPTILLSQPGTGKSRLVRRLAELLSPKQIKYSPAMYVYRFDGAAAFDAMYAGTPKGWSNAQPSVPARAIMASKIANPIAFVDEIEKAAESSYNGNLWSAMTAFLECETATRYRESGIDAELDLSHVVHIATSNSVEKLPAQLKDRFRVIRIPAPESHHLPQLAAQVMREIAIEDDSRMHDEPLAHDELEIIARAWKKESYSMRKLQRLVSATLQARDTCAGRH